jgi:hypothetical protein
LTKPGPNGKFGVQEIQVLLALLKAQAECSFNKHKMCVITCLKINMSKYTNVRKRHDNGNLEVRKLVLDAMITVHRKCGAETTDS